MSTVNRRILETISKSNYPDEVKQLIKALLMIELRNAGDKIPRYSEDYDRQIKKFSNFKEEDEDGNEEREE
jgi:hypothetical protein